MVALTTTSIIESALVHGHRQLQANPCQMLVAHLSESRVRKTTNDWCHEQCRVGGLYHALPCLLQTNSCQMLIAHPSVDISIIICYSHFAQRRPFQPGL